MVPTLPVTGFDVRAYARTAARIDRSVVDAAAFRESPLEPDALRALRYLRAVERSTIKHLRDVLVTPSHTDPQVTAFLTTWAYESYWFGDAVTAILNAHPEPDPPSGEHLSKTRAVTAPLRRVTSEFSDRIGPIWHAVTGNAVGEAYVATHMTWCAVDTWLTQAAYSRVIERTGHPALRPVVGPILDAKSLHLDFYRSQAAARLQASPWARRLTRYVLRYRWSPIAAREGAEVFEYVFGDRRGSTAVTTIDLLVDGLPGMRGVRPASRALGRLGAGSRTRHLITRRS